MKLSIIIPCYNEELVLNSFYQEIIKHLDIDYELIFINDGSKDKTLEVLKTLKQKNPFVKIINFSRNFGKEAAMFAGLEHSKGEYVVVMDADLQDPPHLIKDMIKILDEGEYDCVSTYRTDRKGEPIIRSFFARSFYKIINKLIDVEIVDGARDYRMMKRIVVDSILKMKEVNRFSKGIFSWVGFKTKYIEFENTKRIAGESKWSFFKLFLYAIDGLVSFTIAPLRIATILGIFMSIFGFLYMCFIVVKTFIWGEPVTGFPSIIVMLTLIGGVQLLVLGIVGEYLAKSYLEIKNRPIYIVKDIF